MKPLVTALFLSMTFVATPTTAAPVRAPDVLRLLGGGITVPPEWAGIWMTTDTVYTCGGGVLSTSADPDTLCVGQTYQEDPMFDCSGSVTATTYQMTCTDNGELFPDCNYMSTIESHGTRTGETYFAVVTITTTYTGTGEGCDLLPPQCLQINTHGTRTEPPPAKYCATPAAQATWGEVKALYR
jgi:hypothetical protein